ncbi:MAG TPA: UDP-N-acetylmuramoyl-L-alanine--D-glutamate ligase [Patescibacteria group bacterium]|nr:UDP-N-acetylmuramoyl-L-alanine--D-glutamate ligase [Patescibacteria group bacterium]
MIDLAPLKDKLNGKPILIVGLGKSGMPVFDACGAAGIDCILWDDTPAAREAALARGAAVKDPAALDFSSIAFVCLSPGIPLTHPKPHAVVDLARAAGIEVLGDIELFHRAKPNARTIGITGTNGKSTTTALIGHILKEAKLPSAVGGNIGEAVLTLPDLPENGVYVLEMSSYQTDLATTFAPNISLLVNISPDHLDRHGDMAGYIAAKERMFRGPGFAVISMDDEGSLGVYERLKAKAQRRVIAVSVERPLTHGVFASKEGVLFDGKNKVVDLNTCKALQGQHNWQNAAMAYTAAREAGVLPEQIAKGMQSFPGLAHRQNIVRHIGPVAYINDSKATNDQAAAMALRTFSPIYWIAGGKPKEGGYADSSRHLANVRHAFLIGQAEEEMAEWLTGSGTAFTRCGTIDRAVEAAHRMAQEETKDKAVVLLSPACASMDQFKNFEHRGEVFTELVKALKPLPAEPKKTANGGAA